MRISNESVNKFSREPLCIVEEDTVPQPFETYLKTVDQSAMITWGSNNLLRSLQTIAKELLRNKLSFTINFDLNCVSFC